MLNRYPGKKLRNLRKRANLTQMQVVKLTGISETTIHYLEHDLRRPQTATLEKLLQLYAIRITRLEKMEKIWGEDGLQPAQREEKKPISTRSSKIMRDTAPIPIPDTRGGITGGVAIRLDRSSPRPSFRSAGRAMYS